MADKPVFTSEQIVAQLIRLGVWNAPDAPIAYAYLEQRPSYLPFESSFAPFSAEQRAAAARAFDLIEQVTNLSFVQVADNGAEPGPGNQRLTFRQIAVDQPVFSGSASAYQYGQSPDIYGADIVLNTTGMQRRVNENGFVDWTFYVTLHEILHSVGLSHPGDYNGDGFNYEDDAHFYQDTRQYSVMSYWNAEKTGADHFIGASQFVADTPLLYDILALHTLYGANMSTRTGDSVYGFHSNTGNSPFNFAVNSAPVIAIWDAAGKDALDFSGFAGASLIDLNDGAFSSGGGLTKNVAIAFGAVIENAVGGSGNDILLGNEAANRLDGGAGADRMTGGDGNDLFIVDNAGDRAVEASGDTGADRVMSSVSFTLGARIENLTLTGSAPTHATGNSLANRIDGNDAANLLDGGGRGDTMTGRGGNDLYVVNSSSDKVIETSASHGTDKVMSSISYTLPGFVEQLTLTGTTAINGSGNSLANSLAGNGADNVLRGGAGTDRIFGGAGNDRIYGGSGNDVLNGDAGADRFYFDTAPGGTNVDRIVGFSAAADTIYLDRDIFTAIAATGTLSAAAFRVGIRAGDASDRIVYDKADGQLFYDADGNGAGAALLFATVTPGTTLTNADFVGFI